LFKNSIIGTFLFVSWFLKKHEPGREIVMLSWSVTFFIIAIVAALFGFTGIAASAAGIAKILFFIFLILFIVSLIMPRFRGPPPV
jgi:uncharacterized membrane protein YtjA (UPF0391 family)